MTSIQPQLQIEDKTLIPLIHVGTAIYLLRRFEFNEDGIAELVGNGDLVAWNIGAAAADRRELRIWAPSAEEFRGKFGAHPRKFAWREILETLLPATNKTWIPGTAIQSALNCSGTHVINMVEAGALRVMPGTSYQPGPGGSPQIARDSFTQFLQERLETANNIRGVFS